MGVLDGRCDYGRNADVVVVEDAAAVVVVVDFDREFCNECRSAETRTHSP